MSDTHDEFWKEYAIEEKKMEDANDLLVDSIGREDYAIIVEDCRVTDYLTVVDDPKGDNIFEPYSVFTEVWVDQWSVGDSGDSFTGNIYAKFAEGKWLKIPYDC